MNKAYWQTQHLAKQYRDNIALISFQDNGQESIEQKTSYQDLHHLVEQAKSAISQHIMPALPNKKNKQLIMLVARHTLNSLVYYLAALQLKHVIWWLDNDLSKEKQLKLIRHYQVNLLIDDGVITLLSTVEHKLNNDLALLNTTSGSTGSPALVRLSYQNLQNNCQAICEALALNASDSVLTTLPLHYSFGLSIINTHLSQGTTIVLNEQGLMTRNFWQRVKLYNIRCLYGVPNVYDMLLKLKLTRLSLNSLRFFAVAGGKLAVEKVTAINNWCLAHGKLFFVMYGQTEATARISILSPEKVSHKPSSVGQALQGGKLWLESVDADNAQLCYSGENVMMGIANGIADLSLPAQVATLTTGDLAYQDEEGDFYIVGRLKRFIKILGQRINLDEVEHFFTEQKVTTVCTGRDDLLCCYFVMSTMANEQGIEFYKKLLSQFLNIHSSYCLCFMIDKIPYFSSGKINYAYLEQVKESVLSKKEAN